MSHATFRSIRNRRGVAIATALFALVVVGGLTAGALFMGYHEQRSGRSALVMQEAFNIASGAVDSAVGNWDPALYNQMAPGDEVADTLLRADGSLSTVTTVRRQTDLLFVVSSMGVSPDSSVARRVGEVVRLRPVEVNFSAALATQGGIRVGGSSYIDGSDTPPTGWPACDTDAGLPALTVSDSSLVDLTGCTNGDCLNGTPKIEVDSTMSDSTLTTFGDLEFDELKTMATIILGGATYTGIAPTLRLTDGGCDENNVYNWGDPLNPASPCANRFPFIWMDFDSKITGDVGQGVLIVNGNLEVSGGFEFYGPVIVRGKLTTTGTGGHFNGGVIAANVDLEQNVVLGDAVVTYSSCALQRALHSSASVGLLRGRGWINMY